MKNQDKAPHPYNTNMTKLKTINASSPAKEQVLCFPESQLSIMEVYFKEKSLLKNKLLIDMFLQDVFASSNLKFIDRDLAEVNPCWKQIIPYIVLHKGDEYFVYERTKKGGENRLHNKLSLGVGGHINPIDGQSGAISYEAAFRRELKEEVGLELEQLNVMSSIRALLYDDSDDVGKVHFGIVHKVLVNDLKSLKFNDPALTNGGFQHRDIIRPRLDRFENWSKLILEHLIE